MNSKVTYRQQFTRCGKQRCRKCREGSGHGPYWYAYWSEKGRTMSKYIGATLPDHLATPQQQPDEDGRVSGSEQSIQSIFTPQVRISVLGQFRVEHLRNGTWQAVDSRTWHRRRARALLGCLLSSPGRRLGREQVMEQLWPDLDVDLAANRLNGAVHELRQILEPEIVRPATSRMLRLEREILELADSTQIWVDAEAFERLLKEAETTTDTAQAEQMLEEAAALYHGNYLLEELYSEWATPRRDALQRAWVGLQLNLAHLRAKRGAFVNAIDTLDKLRTVDPLNETALQRLMILLTQRDRRGEALQMYRQHVAMLQREYEGEPLPETTVLYDALRQGHIPPLYDDEPPVLPPGEQQAPPSEPRSTVQAADPLPPVTFTRPVFQLGRHNQSPLIGRDEELETLRQCMLQLEQVTTQEDAIHLTRRTFSASSTSRPRHTHFILLRGETGIGKTRLAEELSLEAYTRGWTVAWSRSYEQEGAIPYRPWTEVLRTLLQSTTTLHELFNRHGQEDVHAMASLKLERLSALLPELAQHTAPGATRSSPPVLHEQERLHLWEAALKFLEVFSQIQPLLLVLDDLHWADESSIELLTYLTHHLHDQRVLLVGTCRDGELTPQHKLRTLMADLQREQTIAVVSVQPLTSSQIGSLVAHLPSELVRGIQTQASGNPFFAEELARYVGTTTSETDLLLPLAFGSSLTRTRSPALRGPKKTEPQARSLPEAVAAVLERRLSRLSNGCQILLGKAAVLGGSFELRQLLPMATENDEDTVLDLLEEALNAGLLIEEGNGAQIVYHFWHPLIISHLYGRLSAARRAQLHRRAAEAIKAANPAQPTKIAAAIAHHLSKGGGEPAMIAYYAELAGHQAYALGGYSEAQRYYLQVIHALAATTWHDTETHDLHTDHDVHILIQRVTSQVRSHFPETDPQRICRLLERVAECSIVLGNFEEARQLYECILDLRTSDAFQRQVYTTTAQSPETRQHEAQIQALFWREIGNAWASTGDYEQAYSCYGRGKEVMLHAGIHSGAAWACIHLQYGAMLRLDGNYHEARRYLQEALEMLEHLVQQGETPQETEAALAARKTDSLPMSTSESPKTPHLPVAKEIPTRTERALMGDPLEIAYAHERLGIVAASLGQLNDALEHMHTALAMYEQSELVSEMARVSGNLGAAYITRGEHEAARTYLQRSLELAKRSGDLPNMAFIMLNLGDVAQRSGDLLEAENWFQQSLDLAERINDREGISWCNSILAAVQQDLGKLAETGNSILRAIQSGRSIKSERCIHFALVGLGDLRIAQAVADNPAPLKAETLSAQSLRLLLRAKATLQRAITLEGMEVENVIDGRYLLARASFLLGDEETALQLAWQTLNESQEYEMTRTSGRLYRLLGLILSQRGERAQAVQCFEQAIQVCREREFRLDHARALHTYGAVLIQRAQSAPGKQTRNDREELYQRGLDHLYEARTIFATCHAAIDLRQVEQLLAQSETSRTVKS